MYRKIIGGIISVVIITIMEIGKLDFIKQDNSVEEMEVSKVEQAEEINEDENETLSDSDDHENVDDFLYKLIKSINLSSYNNVQGSTEEFTDFTILI